MRTLIKSVAVTFFSMLLLNTQASAELNADVIALQDRWAEINYQLTGDEQEQVWEQAVSESVGFGRTDVHAQQLAPAIALTPTARIRPA